MKGIEQYNNARKEIEFRFRGLPYGHTNLIYSLITKADPNTGVVKDISYYDLSKILTVSPAPGRRDTGTPKKETIRSYLRTIEAQYENDFKVITQGQNLQIIFLTLPNIYASHFIEPDEYTDKLKPLHSTNPIEIIEENPFWDASLSEEQYSDPSTEAYTGNKLVKNIFIKNINNKHNKQAQSGESFNLKQPIATNFYPNQETIANALSRGLTNVLNPKEIQKFIKHNIEHNCQWADFNPVFLWWLERETEYRKKIQTRCYTQGNLRSKSNECSPHKNNSYERIMEAAIRDNSEACAPSNGFRVYQVIDEEFDPPTHIMALDPAYEYLRSAVYPQTRE